jgi:hypothetical protein
VSKKHRSPIDVTKSVVLDIDSATQYIRDAGDMLPRIPQPEHVVAALIRLRNETGVVLEGWVTK